MAGRKAGGKGKNKAKNNVKGQDANKPQIKNDYSYEAMVDHHSCQGKMTDIIMQGYKDPGAEDIVNNVIDAQNIRMSVMMEKDKQD